MTLTYEEMSAIYDAQIEALLENNFERYKGIIDYSGNFPEEFTSHYNCWNYCLDEPLSLFSRLPESKFCASQIEFAIYAEEPIKSIVLKDSEIALPDLSFNRSPLSAGQVCDYVFTRPELEEFKRRQLIARFPNLPKGLTNV